MAAYTSVLPGAPTSGNFVVGDTVTDNNGTVWQCTVGGFDAKWVAAPTGLSPTETAVLDGVTPGTVLAGKAVVTTTDKHIDTLVISDGGLKLGAGAGTAVTSTAAELNLLDTSVAGTSVASKALALGAYKNTDILGLPVSGLKIGVAGSETVVSVNANDLNSTGGVPGDISTAATPASGTCAVQLIVQQGDAATALTHAVGGTGWITTAADGLTSAAATSVATLTNGEILTIVTGRLFHYITTATGSVGLTLTAAAGTYYVVLQLPNGKLAISDACVVNA